MQAFWHVLLVSYKGFQQQCRYVQVVILAIVFIEDTTLNLNNTSDYQLGSSEILILALISELFGQPARSLIIIHLHVLNNITSQGQTLHLSLDMSVLLYI